MKTVIEQLAASMGVAASDVQLFARLTATQISNGLDGEAAISAASETMTKLCNRAMRSIADFDATNPYGPSDCFAHTLASLMRG